MWPWHPSALHPSRPGGDRPQAGVAVTTCQKSPLDGKKSLASSQTGNATQDLGGISPAGGISQAWRKIQDLGGISLASHGARGPRELLSIPCPRGGEDLLHLLSAVFFSWKSSTRLWVARPRVTSPVLSMS